MFGRWLKKWNDNFSRKMITTCISTLSTRDLTAMPLTQFAGISASELAKAVSKEAQIPINTPEARLVAAIFATVYAAHFSSLVSGDIQKNLEFAQLDIFSHYYYTDEFLNYLAVLKELADSDLLTAIQVGCVIWLKDPSLTNLKKQAEGFYSAYRSIAQ